MKKKIIALAAAAISAFAGIAAGLHHEVYDATSLNGAWEMQYLPHAWETKNTPPFKGVNVPNAVPGYWEDMREDFRKAGMDCDFRINPWHEPQTFPITGFARDTTLPDIYGTFLYRRTVNVDDPGRPAMLAFEGVRNQVYAWVNGEYAAFHSGYSAPFELRIPDGLLRKGENEILLAVSNNRQLGYCGAYVCGLTSRALFLSTGGINGNLELRFPKNDLADVHVTTAAYLKTFTVHADGAGEYSYTISDGATVVAKGTAKGSVTLPTAGYTFWSPENPKRYTLDIRTPEGGCRQMFGIRRLVADGEKLRLNGRPVYFRGVTEHCYFAKTIHLPRDLDYYRMITAKRKELGFNFVRFHTFIPPVEYLEATDELGMAVHIEAPNFVTAHEFESIVAFARRHPSVVIYCMGNETRIDRIAEAHLEYIAELVHTRTDSLFSPMSALRGIEYALHKKFDPTVPKPFRHNAERVARMSKYCDLFTSYQLGVTSYDSLNNGSSEVLDAWGDAYGGKPRMSHEICIDGSYADLSLEAMYPENSPIHKAGIFSGIRGILAKRGLLDRADTYFRNSCEWMWRIRKHCFEKMRGADRVAGFDFLGDINTHWHTFGYSVGMMDEFYRLKPGESVENVLRYNSAAVILSSLDSDFNVNAGANKRVAFKISNYDDDAPASKLRVTLDDAATGATVFSAELDTGSVRNGCIADLGATDVAVPPSATPKKYFLQASFAGGKVSAKNEWEIYAFPPKAGAARATAEAKVVNDISEADLAAAMEKGERVLLLGTGPFKYHPTTYRIGLAGRCSGDLATVIKKGHPALAGLPHEGFCGWQFRRLMEGGRSVQLEADVPFDPIIDIATSVKFPIRQAGLFEYRIGNGRLLVCSFKFGDGDPAARWLKARLAEYAASADFKPAQRLTLEQLHAVIAAPLLSGQKNTNRARNANDPSDEVRAGPLAQP